MSGPRRIHHINFVVRDLDAAIQRYERDLGLGPFTITSHAPRDSRIAFTRVGDSWFVLVCPNDEDSVPGRHLKAHGEGFFLLSFGVDGLESAITAIDGAGRPRSGIEDWRIADIGNWFGAELQLTEDAHGQTT